VTKQHRVCRCNKIMNKNHIKNFKIKIKIKIKIKNLNKSVEVSFDNQYSNFSAFSGAPPSPYVDVTTTTTLYCLNVVTSKLQKVKA
jgi:hypothetical protein